MPVLAEASKVKLEDGSLQLNRGADGKFIRPGERVLVGAGTVVGRPREQLFYMDEGTDAEFETDADVWITGV